MPTAAEHAFKGKSTKSLILLPLRAIYNRTFQYETPCINVIVAYCNCEVAKKEQCKLLKICMKEPYFTDYFDTEFLTLCRAARNKVLYAVSSLQSSYSEVPNRRTCSHRFFSNFFPILLTDFQHVCLINLTNIFSLLVYSVLLA